MNVAARLEQKSFFRGGNAMAEKDWERKAEKAAQKKLSTNPLLSSQFYKPFREKSPPKLYVDS